MSIVLAIVNQKGGVGKTTTSINISAGLAEKGFKTLLIDIDPQGNATSGLGIEKNSQNDTIYNVLIDEVHLNAAILETGRNNFKIVPSNIDLAGAEVELVNFDQRENRLKKAIDLIRNDYDYIIIDCPPSLGMLTVNGLVAADGVFIPVQSEYYALEGVTQLVDTIAKVKNSLNKNLKIFGVLITMFDRRTSLSHQVAEEINNYFKEISFKTMIPRSVRLSEAPSFGQSIIEYACKSKGCEAYNQLVKEIIKRKKNFFITMEK